MITLKDWMDLVDMYYEITEGSDYHYNDQILYALNSWEHDSFDGYVSSIIYDPIDVQRVYFVEVCDYKNQRAYRRAYAEPTDVVAWDSVEWVNLETDEDFIEKATAIKNGEDYDTRISIPLTLKNDEMLALFMIAHERDMTFNAFVEQIIKQKLTSDSEA